MKTNLSLTTADIVTLIAIAIIMAFAVRVMIGFFRTPKRKKQANVKKNEQVKKVAENLDN